MSLARGNMFDNDPFLASAMTPFTTDFDRLASQMFSSAALQPFESNRGLISPFARRGAAGRFMAMPLNLDMTETPTSYILHADIPGLTKKDISCTIDNGFLILSGERSEETERDDVTRHIVERRYGKFERRVRLPTDLDENKVKSKVEGGVLELEFGKKAEHETGVKKIAL